MQAEQLIRAGELAEAKQALQGSIRDDPANPSLRTFLFQLYCVTGEWDKALTQLNVVADMDAEALLMAQTYRELLQCEGFRDAVFDGRRAPLLFGEPSGWIGGLVQALGAAASGDHALAANLVDAALDSAPARSGTIDDAPFAWFGDADQRIAPVFELILNGRYYWVPVDAVADITFSEPEDLRDLVWLPVQITWVNEGNSIGFMPTRYPGTATLTDPQCALARKTDWVPLGDDRQAGAGQRLFATDQDDYPLLQTRHIVFDPPEAG